MPATTAIFDLTPKFLKFYDLARGADPDRRWQLWREHYGFVALPPTEEGMRPARGMLDACFDRYAQAMPRILNGAEGFRPEPQTVLDQVCRTLAFSGDLAVQTVLYVGMFDHNAFAFTNNGVPFVNFPVEEDRGDRLPTMAHEYAHVVHERLSGSAGGYVRPIGMLALMEGLAIRTAMAVAPGRPETDYLGEFSPNWAARCRQLDQSILRGVRQHVHEASAEAMQQFTLGSGTTGIDREAYWVGWRVTGHLLAHGYTLGQLVRIPEAQVPMLVEQALQELAG